MPSGSAEAINLYFLHSESINSQILAYYRFFNSFTKKLKISAASQYRVCMGFHSDSCQGTSITETKSWLVYSHRQEFMQKVNYPNIHPIQLCTCKENPQYHVRIITYTLLQSSSKSEHTPCHKQHIIQKVYIYI